MPYKIVSSQCTNCTACEAVCPNMAISEQGNTFVIDPEKCTECVGHFDDAQCVSICPIDNTCVIDNALPRYAG
jgi:ferredoxin